MYPEIFTYVKSFIEQSSNEAHLRRRDSVMYTNGVSLFLGITVSHIVHRLMLPPRRKTRSSKNYEGLIEARVPPPKRNTKEKDFHFTCAEVRHVNEMSYLCKE